MNLPCDGRSGSSGCPPYIRAIECPGAAKETRFRFALSLREVGLSEEKRSVNFTIRGTPDPEAVSKRSRMGAT